MLFTDRWRDELALYNMFELVYQTFEAQRVNSVSKPYRRTALMGPFSSAQTRAISGLATVNTAPIVSYSATVASLSSKLDYPWFYRMCYSDATRTKAVADLMTHFGWRKAVMLTTTDLYGTATSNSLASQLKPGAITVYTYDVTSLDEIAQSIKASGLKIIFLLPSGRFDDAVNCLALGQGSLCGGNYNMTVENGYVWILSDAFPLYQVNPPVEYCNALSGSLVLSPVRPSKWTDAAKGATVLRGTSKTIKQIAQEAIDWYSNNEYPVYYPDHFWTQEYVPFIVDAFYAVAYAYKSLRVNGILPTGCALKAALKNTSFAGYSGNVQFNEQQDRTVSQFEVTTVVAGSPCSDVGNERTQVGVWDSVNGLVVSQWPPAWRGNVPVDGFVLGTKPLPTRPLAGLFITMIFSFGMAVPTLTLLIRYRLTAIVQNAPPLHLALLTSSLILMLSSLIPLTSSPTKLSCITMVALPMVGYSLIIVTLGIKAFVYELLSHSKDIRLPTLSNKRLLLLLLVALSPPLIIGTIVLASDPPLPVTTIDNDMYTTRCVTHGNSGPYVILGLMLILSVIALVVAWRNRNTTFGEDAKFILAAIGNTALLGLIGIGIGYILRMRDYSAVVIIFIVTILFGTVATWLLIFAPIIFRMYNQHKSGTLWKPQKPQTRQLFDLATQESLSRKSTMATTSSDTTDRSTTSSHSSSITSSALPQQLSAPLLDQHVVLDQEDS